MSYVFGTKSKEQLETCHPDIQKILEGVIKYYDFSILEGARTKATQMKYFREGKSTLDGIRKKSKHQSNPSMAVDIMPWKKGTNAFSGKELDTRRFYYLMGLVKMVTEMLLASGEITHNVRFGIDWDSDDVFSDQSFHDAPHFELVTTK